MGSSAMRPRSLDMDSTAELGRALQRFTADPAGPAQAPPSMAGPGRERQRATAAGCVLWLAMAAAVAAARHHAMLAGAQAWAAVAVLLLALAALPGIAVCGRAAGILVGANNLMSLARLQMLVWSVLLLSAYATAVLGRLGLSDPLAVQAGPWLLALAGLAGASSLAAPLLALLKRGRSPQRAAIARAAGLLGRDPADVAVQATGVLFGKASPGEARLADLLRGDEVGNAHAVDLSKVQLLACTLLAALAYGASVFRLFADTPAADITALPAPSPSLLALLALSHAGYLAGACIRHTPADGEAALATPEPPGPTRAELAIQSLVASAQRSQELVRAIERSTSAQARYTGSLAEGVASLLAASSHMQERSGRDVGDAIDGLAESLAGLQAAAKTQARSTERILDVTRRLEEIAREQGLAARRR